MMTSACVTSFVSMASLVAVATLWMTYVMTTALTTSSVPPSVSGSGGADHDLRDEEVCRTRYLSSANGSEGAGAEDVVGIAAVLEVRRPKGGGCGAVYDMGLQSVAALFWAVSRLNGHTPSPGQASYIPGVHLELRVYDDCSHDVLAARHVGQLLSSHPDFNCTPASPPLAGVLGTTTSHTTTFVAGLLSSTNIPHFGTSATVSVLSDNVTYPNFYRTVPSDLTQSKVLVDLVQRLQWTYVVGMYTRDNYGTEGYQEFKRLATRAGVCVFKEKSFWHSDQDLEDNMERFIRELLIELGNTRFSSLGVIYFGHDTEAITLFNMISDRRSKWHDQQNLNRLYWLVSDGVSTSRTVASLVTPYTLLSISPATNHLEDINDFFFHVLDNPEELGPYWQILVREFLQEVQGCFEERFPVSRCQLRDKIEAFDYISAALDSFYSLAALLGQAHQEACDDDGGGGGNSGLCRNMSEALKNGLLSVVRPQAMNYSLHFSPERLPAHFRQDRMLVLDEFGDFMPANSPLYFINLASNGQWTKIGEYGNGSLQFHQITDLTKIPRSECGANCQQCRRSNVTRFAYHPGDVLLLGLYSISSPRESASFSCGDYRRQSSSVAALLAFLQTIQSETRNSGRSRFGALVLDDCYNKLTASALLSDLFSGKTTLYDPLSGEAIDMKKVVAVIGSQSSSVTLSSLSLLTPLHIPSISYSATSPDLDDRLSYPYFLRPVPSDSQQAQAMVEVVRLLNITYVGLLHQDNNYGWRGMQTFVELAEEQGICVESPVPVKYGDSHVDLHQILQNIRNRDAKVVVVFLVEPTVLKLLDSIQSQNLDLIFLASEAWTLSTNTLHNQRGMTARGSLVLTVDTSRQAGNVKMADYLKELTTPELAVEHELPWMRDFWENEKQCNLPGGFTNSYNTMCASDIKLSKEVAKELAEDQKVVQTINAVASVTTALRKQCGGQSDPAGCMLALSSQQATDLIRSIWLEDQNGQDFKPYLKNGNGNVGFTLHNIQKTSPGTYGYVQVGRYNPNDGLQILKDIVFYDPVGQPLTDPLSSSCNYKVQCQTVCGRGSETTLFPPITATQPLVSEEEGEGGLVVAVVVLALLCGLLVALLLAVVCCAKRRGRIPWLGMVKKRDVGAHVSQQTSRMSVVGGRMEMTEGGEINAGFSPTSPRVSLPLPPLPRSSSEVTTYHYNVPSDLDRMSTSSGASASQMVTSPGMFYDDRAHSDDEVLQRRPPRHQSRHQHQDLRRQIQELSHQRELQEQQRFRSSTNPEAARSGKDMKRRARSVPRVVRPGFLPVQGQQMSTSVNIDGMDGQDQDGRRFPGRPRSQSHDAGLFRERLGALSDDDQQVLLKYLMAHQHSYSPSTTPQRVVTSPVTSSEVASERAALFLQSERARMPDSLHEEVASPNIVFENPPSFCSSGRMSLNRELEDNPSLLYLHAVPTEKDMYMEVIADPVEHPSSPDSHHSTSPITSAHSPSLIAFAGSAPGSAAGSSAPAQSSPFRASPGPAAKETSPRTPSSSSAMLMAASSQSPQTVTSPMTSAMSPLTSVRGSTASESSGAVFMSPDREFSSQFKYVMSPENVLPNNAMHLSTHSNLGSASVDSGPAQHSPMMQQQNRNSPGIQHLPHTSSPTHQTLPVSDTRPGGMVQGDLSPGSRQSTPQISPQSAAAAFPGILVRDRAGAVFWLPSEVVSPSQHRLGPGYTLSPGHSPPAVIFSQGAGNVSPQTLLQLQRSDLAQSSMTAELPPTQLPHTGGPQQRAAAPTSPNYRQPMPATLTPHYRQQSPVNLTPAHMQQTPVNLTPAHMQQTPVNLTPAHMQQTPVTFAPTHVPQTMASEAQAPTIPIAEARTKAPRMDVDSLSVSTKQPEVVDQNHNTDGELFRMVRPESHPVAIQESVTDTPKTSSWDDLSEHPGSPQTPQVSGHFSDMPSPHEERVSLSEEQQPVPTPSPCKPVSGPEVSGSGDSNQTSGDSGTGEDLNTDAENVNSEIEISV